MSEASEKVIGVRDLPIFPLSIVLFPGVPLPLHIFEQRYRQMLNDIRVSNNLFGISYFDVSTSQEEVPPAGHVGCVAEVSETQTLPDGRSNILTVGVIRYRIEEYVVPRSSYDAVSIGYPGLVFHGRIAANPHNLGQGWVHFDFEKAFGKPVRTINDERASLPDISDTEPQQLSFLVAAAMEVDTDLKQELLEMRSTSERLRRLRDMLARAVTSYEERARIHEMAKGNGHSGRKIEIE